MIGSVYLVLFIFVLLFIVSVLYEYRILGFIFSIVIVFYSEYNLKINILTHCAGCCNSVFIKIRDYLKGNYNCRNRKGVYCSTPEMQNRYTSGIFNNESLLSPIRKNDESEASNGFQLNKSREVRPAMRPNRLSRYSLSEDSTYSSINHSKLNNSFGSPQLRSRAAGVKTTQTVAGPLLASTRHKIDPYLLTDVNSPGLTRRIVQYNETAQNERPTIEPRYKGVGQLPIINLNKNHLRKLPINKSTVKIRIAPPDSSSYMTEQRLLMHNSDQHRPLVPSPLQEIASSPTKSVLEALKEISRKRIHTQDEIEYSYTEDLSKKQRKDSLSKNGMSSMPFARPPISKRSRDDESHEYIDCSMLSNKPSPTDSTYKSWRPKKKHRNDSIKCNDILSSLSSSRHLQRENYKRKAELSPKDNAKQLKLTVHNVSHISISGQDESDENNADTNISHSIIKQDKSSTITIVDEPEKQNKPKEIPRIVMFNKVIDTKADICVENSDDDSDSDRMPFVKPREEMYSENCATSLNYTEKCKLAQMLNCLSDKSLEEVKYPKETKEDSRVIIPVSKTHITDKRESSSVPSTIPTTTSIETKTSESSSKTTTNNHIITSSSGNNSSVSSKSQIITNSLSSSNNEVTSSATNTVGGFSFPITTSALNSTKSLSLTTQSSHTTLPFSFGKSNQVVPTSSVGDVKNETVVNTTILSTSSQNSIATLQPTSTSFATPTSSKNESILGNLNSTFVKPSTSSSNISTTSITTTASLITNNSSSLFSFGSKPLVEEKKTEQPSILNANTVSNASIINQDMVSKNKEPAKPSASPFTFGSSSTNSAALSTPLFNIGSTNNQTKPAFGNASPAAVSSSSSSNTFGGFSATTTATSNSATGTFSFGSVTNTTATTIFGSNKPSTFSVATSTAASTTSASFNTAITSPVFGGNKASSFGSSAISFGTKTTSTASFASVVSNTAATVAVSSATASTFSVPSTTTSSSIFGSVKSPITFGANTSSAPSFGLGSSAFGNNTQNTTAPAFGTSVTTALGSATTTTTFGTPTTSAQFGSSTTASLFGGASTVPTFGGSGITSSFGATNAASVFGGASTTTPSFGNATTAPAFGTTTTASAFGKTTTAPAFGTTTTAPAFGTTTTAPAFGTTTTAPAFGTTTTAPAFGTTTTAPAFGTTTTAPAFGTTTTAPAFGTTTTAPTFGTANTAPAFGTTTTASAFGMTATVPAFGAASPPAFGSTITSPSFGTSNSVAFGAGSTTGSPFGVATTAATFGTGTSTVSFGSGSSSTPFSPPTTNTSSVFGAGSQPASQGGVFTFGSGSNNTSATPFQFGSQTTVGKSFNFTASAPTPNFGSGSQGMPTPNFNNTLPAGGFGAAPTPGGFGATPAGNMFSIGTGGGATKSRVRARRQR